MTPLSQAPIRLASKPAWLNYASMRTPPVLLFVTLLAGAIGTLPAQETAARGGVAVSLSTSGRVFAQPTVPPPTAIALPPTRTDSPLKFAATITLFNRSSRGIDFNFPSADAAKQHFAFQILDAAGNLVWQSAPPAPAAVTDPV